ncbi:uncharacterized protein LOC111707136 [Eurytemora carolleeae]|uniref:uncharacterized protein LOC111707136 n=1 Tax=Eurytemora carolleeae TaxID=1294199 RepID=UPI000C772336|nr:uncharacterized protein LOC111707136 [Eurytemora carolleeae]|eukprot:XP_023335911.1 uncharacterized protein LOC111707136 [Eurytemora affinis]
MIRFDSLRTEDTDPVALSQYGNFWTWAGGSYSMDVYWRMAQENQDPKAFAEAIMKYVGFDNSAVDDAHRYQLTVFSKSGNSFPFSPFQPTWSNLFGYLQSFEFCKFEGDNDLCAGEEWDVVFNEAVRTNLTSLTASGVTDCPASFGCANSQCSQSFCDMNSHLTDERYANGVKGATMLYRSYTSEDGVSIPMLDMIDDQARAFFNVVVGATWLFTGNGNSNNGIEDTGPEYIVRGDVPLTLIGGARKAIYPPAA